MNTQADQAHEARQSRETTPGLASEQEVLRTPFADAHYMVVTGGVISGLGKGVLTASLAALFSSKSRIVCIKCDGYLNADPGTINPIEHGEVYVLHDGGEVDMDFGHYERLIGIRARRDWNITMGKVYQQLLQNERRGVYLGKTVQLIPHATNEIKERIYSIARREAADLVFIEIGGTVGDLENELFIEAIRQIRSEVPREQMLFSHLTYIPIVEGSRELKSKPTQSSVKMLNQAGIYPDIIFCRSEQELTDEVRDKISLYCNVEKEAVLSNPNVRDVNFLPEHFERQGINTFIEKRWGQKVPGLSPYRQRRLQTLHNILISTEPGVDLDIAICGKYTKLEDSYASIHAAILHAAAHVTEEMGRVIRPRIYFTNVEQFSQPGQSATASSLSAQEGEGDSPNTASTHAGSIDLDALHRHFAKFKGGIIVPGGFGLRGMEEKIAVIRYAREHGIPFMGICLGMQLAVIEYARHVCHISHANTEEIRSLPAGGERGGMDEGSGIGASMLARASFSTGGGAASANATSTDAEPMFDPVIHLLPEQKYIELVGGTMRLGGHKVHLRSGSRASSLYGGADIIEERFRHRYEVNHAYLETLEKHGMVFSGVAPGENGIRQVFELPEHPYFMGGQFHPELNSTLERPAPFFVHFLRATAERVMGMQSETAKPTSDSSSSVKSSSVTSVSS